MLPFPALEATKYLQFWKISVVQELLDTLFFEECLADV